MVQEAMDLEQAIVRVALGDATAFRLLYELTHDHLQARALRIVKRRDLAEDVLQEVYVNVWERAGQYDPAIARPMTWLIAMVRHRAIDVLRARRGEQRHLVEADEAMEDGVALLPDRAAADGVDPLDLDRLGEWMHGLAAPHRQSLALAYYGGLSHAEVASHLSAPIGSVKGWIHRGLDHLRRRAAAGVACTA